MNAVESNLDQLIDQLSLALVTVDSEDLITLGEILEKVERLIEIFETVEPVQGKPVVLGMKKAIENIILEQAPSKEGAMEAVAQGVGILQDLSRNLNAGQPYTGNLSEYWTGLEREGGVALRELGIASEENGGSGPSEKPQPVPASPDETRPDIQSGLTGDFSEDQDLFFGFVSESLEHIESIEVNIITLEQETDNKEVINSVFRPFHTIKGVSGFLNLKHIHKLAHEVEGLLDLARTDRLEISSRVIDVILDAVDLLKKMVSDVRVHLETQTTLPQEYGQDAFIDRIQTLILDSSGAREAEGESLVSHWRLGEIMIDQGLIREEELERVLARQEEERLRKLGEILVQRGLIAPEELEVALQLQKTGESRKIGEILIETGKIKPQEISQAIEEQEQLRERRLGEILIREKQADARGVTAALREQRKGIPDTSGARTVKVDTLKLDLLVDMVGELVIAQSLVNSNPRVQGLKDQKLVRDMGQMARITSDLQKTAMAMRMVPIKQTFQKMIRLVRDLSRKSSKLVDLTMSGEDTEIDRNMVEAIYDPLVHMVRNSIDHGVESPDARREKGKKAEGVIHLEAYHQGGNVVIEISDDGQGLNAERILAKALDKGLVDPAESLSELAILNLVFLPGFSTAEKITDVSGRGVGMDVVKRAIERLRGKIEITSVWGKGSKFTIRLPLTLAIIDGMIIRVGDHRYILPTMAIHESFRPAAKDYHTVKGQEEMIQVRDHLLPLVRLDGILGTVSSVHDPTEALVIVVENDGERRCILVDEVLGKQEVVIKSLGERLKYVRGLAGGSILGDGRVGLILDVAGLFEVSDGQAGRAAGTQMGGEDWDMDDDWGMGAA